MSEIKQQKQDYIIVLLMINSKIYINAGKTSKYFSKLSMHDLVK